VFNLIALCHPNRRTIRLKGADAIDAVRKKDAVNTPRSKALRANSGPISGKAAPRRNTGWVLVVTTSTDNSAKRVSDG
jgi:hypothetical protein